MVDAMGVTRYSYTAGNQLLTEDGPFDSDTVTNSYVNRLRTKMTLQQPSGRWTNAFGYDAAARLTNVTSPAGAFGYPLFQIGPVLLPAFMQLSKDECMPGSGNPYTRIYIDWQFGWD